MKPWKLLATAKLLLTTRKAARAVAFQTLPKHNQFV